MSKISVALGAFTVFLISSFSAAASGREVANGGGGLMRNGDVVTFGSAVIPLKALDPAVIAPLLSETIAAVKKLDLGEPFEAELVEGLQLTERRQYFNISTSDIHPTILPTILKKLLAQYGEIKSSLPVPQNMKVVLFAMTAGSDTFLLPSFYKLPDDQSKMAILFHEAIRKQFPKTSTSDVVHLEMAFEDNLRKKNDIGIYEEMAKVLDSGHALLALRGYALHDIAVGALGNLVTSSGQISLAALFGQVLSPEKFAIAVQYSIGGIPGNGEAEQISFDQGQWLKILIDLQSRFPKSLVLDFLSKNYDTLKLYVTAWPHCENYIAGADPVSLGSRFLSLVPVRAEMRMQRTFEAKSYGDGVLADMLQGTREGSGECYSEVNLTLQDPLYP